MKKMINKFKKNLGITLIALVVTIVVLLILAGISISMLTGQNGILNRAQEAKEKTKKAQIDESDKMVQMEAMVQASGKSIPNPSSYGENPNAQATADGAGKYFALPDGAKYITGTVDTGVVVEIKGSEFVWVPVDDVVLDTNRISDLPTSSENGISSGKTYTPMAVKVGDDYKGILYDFDESNGYLLYPNNENYLGNSDGYREPDIVSNYDGGDSDTVDGKITIRKLTAEYNAMISSILKYKGFYIARYEAGLDKTTNEIVFKNASIEANNVITTDTSNIETSRWYGLYQKIKTFTTDSDKVVSSMIWGSQYDAMMNWMAKNRKNVGNTDNKKRNSMNTTGSNTNDIINNIYDLYGCHYEWTLETYSDSHRARRGGDLRGNYSPASRYFNEAFLTYSFYSSRATLYIK
jgi:hypothetical protein